MSSPVNEQAAVQMTETAQYAYGSAVMGDAIDDHQSENGSDANDWKGDTENQSTVSSATSGSVGPSVSRPLGQKHLNWYGAFTVQLITMIGAGILFYPYLFSSLGYVLSILFLVLAAITQGGMCVVYYHTVQGLKAMYPDAQITRLEHVAELCYGKWAKYAFFAILYATLFVLASTFLILVGELMTGFSDIGNGNEVANVPTSNFYWSMIFTIPQLLMAWLPDLKSLKYVLNIGTVAIFIVVITQIVLCSVAISDDVAGNNADVEGTRAVAIFPDDALETWKLVLGSLTTFLYGFGALIVSGQIITDMGPVNHKDFPKAVYFSHTVVTGIYLLFGAMGYAAFGSASPPSFLSPASLIAEEYYTYWSIASACTITNASVTIPIFLNSLFRGAVQLLPEKHREDWKVIYPFRTLIVLLAMALACTPAAWFADLTGLIPMCTIAMICIILPSLFFWCYKERKYSNDHDLEGSNKGWCGCIKENIALFSLHVLMNFAVVIAIIWGFWTSLESLIDNINGV